MRNNGSPTRKFDGMERWLLIVCGVVKMVKTIGFIGLGQMGRWMALNLVNRHFDLTVFDINEEAMAFLTKQKAFS